MKTSSPPPTTVGLAIPINRPFRCGAGGAARRERVLRLLGEVSPPYYRRATARIQGFLPQLRVKGDFGGQPRDAPGSRGGLGGRRGRRVRWLLDTMRP